MGWLVRRRSRAYRLRDGSDVTAERFGPLHHPSAMLERGSITKTVTARIAERLAASGAREAPHPFYAIAFDGDGRCTPHVDPEQVDVDRRRWQEANAVDLPTIEPPAR